MAKNLSNVNLGNLKGLMLRELGTQLLNTRQRGKHWWFVGEQDPAQEGPVYGVRVFEYSPGIWRLTTMYARDQASRYLAQAFQSRVSTKGHYELSFLASEAELVIPWGLADLQTQRERPDWAYEGYWHRHADAGSYLWSKDGWALAEKQRGRVNLR